MEGGVTMESKDTLKLLALTDTTCEFLMTFLRKHKESNCEKIQKHIEINKPILDSKIDLLKKSDLISNHTVHDENGNVVDRRFSLTDDGEKSLIKLGYEF